MNNDPELALAFGRPVCDGDGTRPGTVGGFDEHDTCVTAEDGSAATSPEHLPTGAARGVERAWRCWECGETDGVEEGPDRCPACEAARGDISHWTAD